MTTYRHFWMAFVFLCAVGFPAYQTIQHTQIETQYFKKSYDTNNFKNNGAIKEAELWKEIASKHHFLGPLIKDFFAPSINQQFDIPTPKQAQANLDEIPGLIEQAKDEQATAFFWSAILLGISLLYFSLTIIPRNKARADHIFALTMLSVVFLVVGVLAPAMVIIVSPNTNVFPHFVLHYQIRSIFGVISELYASNYWIVGVCLTVFSILIPLTKAGLTVFALEFGSLPKKRKIAEFLHAISKWSMADVFVAAILLANFAARANHSTQANLFLGFYYFLGYCLLSLLTTMLLEHKFSGAPGSLQRRPGKQTGLAARHPKRHRR